MKKKFILIFIGHYFILSLLLGCTPKTNNLMTTHETNNLKRSDVINVIDYGAVGDGLNDDTGAILKAIAASENQGFSQKKINNELLGKYFGGAKKLYFPFGHYKISSTLKFGSYVNIEGDKAVLSPTKQFEKSANFACEVVGWQCKIDGLQFVGFKNALKIDNNNLNTGRVSIENCDFINNGISIQLAAKSSISIIRENRFVENDKTLIIIEGDKVVFSQNWVQSGFLKGIHDAQIINHNSILHFNENLLVPKPPEKGAIEPAWINNYNSIIAYGVRQGGESGSFALINNFAKARTSPPVFPNCVIVKDSECYGNYGNTQTYKHPAVLRLIEVPNQIVIENVRGMINGALMDYSQHSASSKRSSELLDPDYHEVKVDGIISPWVTRRENFGIPADLNKVRKQN